MSITYQCGQCGRWETVRESKVGTIARCKDCGLEAPVPNTPDLFDDRIDGPAGGAAPPRSPGPGWGSAAGPSPEVGASARSAVAPAASSGGRSWIWVVGVIALIAFRVSLRAPGLFNGRARPPRPPFQIRMPPARPDLGKMDGPIAVPEKFPDLGPAREVEPGVVVHEVRLRPEGGRRLAQPGHEMTLWLYLPKGGEGPGARPVSLPCVLVAPAGSRTMLSGMKLDELDRPEHLPYVRAGFAVLAFSLDGPDPGPGPAAFLRARAGLVNGRIAREFLKAKAPQVDPGRLYVAGHSSAATFALLLAENEPDLKGCVAYAPVVDLPPFIRAQAGRDPGLIAFIDLAPRFSPRQNEAKLNCPVFLFVARDDAFIDFREVADLGERLKALKKPVTLDVVDSGGHIDAMNDEGLSRGVAWLKKRDAEVIAGR